MVSKKMLAELSKEVDRKVYFEYGTLFFNRRLIDIRRVSEILKKYKYYIYTIGVDNSNSLYVDIERLG